MELIEQTIPLRLGDWIAEMTWTEEAPQGGPSRLVIRPAHPDNVPAGGLSSTVLRKIDFQEGAAKLRAMEGFAAGIKEATNNWPNPIGQVREALTEGVTNHYLALLAERYVTLINTGQEKPVDYLASELGRSPGTVKSHLWQARTRGILVGGSAGRKGGHVSEEGRQLAFDWYQKRERAANPD